MLVTTLGVKCRVIKIADHELDPNIKKLILGMAPYSRVFSINRLLTIIILV